MQTVLLVFLGGGLGSVLRYGTGVLAARLIGLEFPWGTLLVNLIGCTVMGVFARLLPAPDDGGAHVRLLLMTGVLGGYTTFSAFALDAATLWMNYRPAAAAVYLGVSVLGSLIGVALGLMIGKSFLP